MDADQLRPALLITSALLRELARGQEGRKAMVNIEPPWEGTIGEALDLADHALEIHHPEEATK